MADLANLRISVDSRAVKGAVTDLAALGRESEKTEGSLKKLGVASAILGTALAAGFIMAAKSAIAFEKSIAEISTLVDTTVVSVDQLSTAVRNQSKEFGGDVQTQAKALYQIISAGASDAATANNILTTANKLAVGGVTDVATAADGLTSVLNAYGNQVAGATAVSDAMFIAMKAGKTTIGELSASIGTVAPLAAQMGISFDELTAGTAALTKGGVSTSVAITGLRAILATIAKPSKEATDLAAELGIEFNSTALEAKGLGRFLEELKQKTGGSSDAMATLFGGVEALVPALALSGKAGEDMAAIMGQMAVKTGASDEAFGKMAQTFDFQFGKAVANVNDMILSLGLIVQNTLLPVLTFFNNNLVKIQETFRTLAFAIGGATAAFVALQLALGVKALIGFGVQLGLLISGMGLANFATVAATFALNAFKIALASTGIGLVVVAIGTLVGAMYGLKTAQSEASAETDRLRGSLRQLAAERSADFNKEHEIFRLKVRQQGVELKGLLKANEQRKLTIQQGGSQGLMAATEYEKTEVAIKKKTAALKADLATFKESRSINTAAIKEHAENEAAAAAATTGASAAIADKGKKTKKTTDSLMEYYEGLVETSKYLGITNEYEIQAAKARDAGRNSLAADIILQGKANDAAQLLLDNEKKRQDFIKGTLADLLFENTLIGLGVKEREKAIAVRALENAMLASTSVEYQNYLAAVATGSDNKVLDDQNKRVDALRAEVELMRLAPEAAAARAAALEAERLGLVAGKDAYIAFLAAAAEATALEKTRDALKEIADAMKEVKDMTFDIDLEGVFGNIGKAVGGLVNVYDDFAKRQEVLAKAMSKDNKDEAGRRLAQQKSIRNEVNLYGNLAASAKGFFKEKSTGYKVMQAAETAFRAFEFAMSIKAMAMKAAETTATVAAEGTKTAVQTASGASKIFSQLGVFAFPIVAAMIAVMASLGGKGGSSASPSIPSAEDMQATQGAGSVLGDATAKSDSINRALEIMAKNSNTDLEYSNQMLLSLRSIQSNMANLSNNVAKQISVSGGMFDTSGQRLGSTGSGGFLGIGASSTTRELQDLGIDIVSSSIAEIIAGGISGSTYQVVQQVKKKSGFFGIGGSTKTSFQTTTGSIDQEVRNSITGVIASLRQGLIDGADVIGLQGAQAILDAFEVNIGRISLSGLTGQEIEEQLNAIFSKVGDQMAGALLPSLTEMQRIGEGLFETFARVAREYQVVDIALRSIGKEFGAVGIASVAARSGLVQMFESLDQFVEQTNFFRDNFLTEAEQLAPITRAVADELQRLGLSSITTIEQFKGVVLGLDLTTAAGQETYAALLQVAPAFKKVADAADEALKAANQRVSSAETNLAAAVAAEQQRRIQLRIKRLREEIKELDKVIAGREQAKQALRAAYNAEVSRIDGEISNRQKNIQSLKSAFEAQASVINGTVDKFRDFATSMREFAASIIPLNATGPSSISALRKKFAELAKLAIGGDTGAMGRITDVGGALRDAITSGATDRVSMLRDLYALQFESEQVAAQAEAQASIAEQQLAVLTSQYNAMISAEERAIAQFEADKVALAAQVEQFILLNDKVLSVDEAIKQLQTAEQAALEAEAQKVKLEKQIKSLEEVGINTGAIEKAQRELEEAKAARDVLLQNTTQSGFDSVVSAVTASAATISSAVSSATAAAASAAAATAAASVVSVLPNNVIPFPIMGGGFGAGGGNREFGINNNILPFANGGIHSGGLRIVGENGPELEATGPSRIYNANQLDGMMGGGTTAEEVKALRQELKLAMYQIAKNTGKSYDLLDRWNGDGLPPERIVA